MDIKRGDIIRVGDTYHREPHYYEVAEIRGAYVVSQPADYMHRICDITAIYRFDGKDFKCVWEKGSEENGR